MHRLSAHAVIPGKRVSALTGNPERNSIAFVPLDSRSALRLAGMTTARK